MRKIVAKKYTYPTGLIIFIVFFILAIFVGFGIFFTYLARQSYLTDVEIYEMDLWMYHQGFDYYPPTKPVEPISKYVWINVGFDLVGIILSGIMVAAFIHDNKGPENVIRYDEEQKTLLVYEGFECHSVPITSIQNIDAKIGHGIIATGRIIIPTVRKTNQIVIEYLNSEGKKRKVISNAIEKVDRVIEIINLLKRKAEKKDPE